MAANWKNDRNMIFTGNIWFRSMAAYSFSPLTNIHEATITRKHATYQHKGIMSHMGPSYQKSVRESLPNADIVFDRFHVMKNYSDVIKNQRRIDFRKAHASGKDLLKGSHYLLLK